MVESLELSEVPFYWRIKKTANQPPHDVPATLPFAFSFLDDLQLVIQKRNPVVLKWLEYVYKENANVGYLQEGHALAESYGGEFIDFFRRASALLPQLPASAADIGCGGVYLLQKMREQGLTVKGIDPSPVTAAAGRKAGIAIISDFYPSPSLTERFDVLFHYDVLEHVEDPVTFLRAHHANLSSQGALIFAVPDCSQHIELGDVSMLLHEHLNYFDSESLAYVVRAAGFEPLLLEPARHGGVLLCCAVPVANHVASQASAKGDSKFRTFRAKAQTALQRFATLTDQSSQGELGMYVPLRAFPYLGQLPSNVQLRFFDDDPGLRGRYYDGFDVVIESRDELVARPPRQVIICSLSFGHKIAERLREKQVGELSIIMWSELFEEEIG
jgi:2-polyprenyl-3-methyl-5-hydroxy-6-metoxy-1,4-benzoquinol methylase